MRPIKTEKTDKTWVLAGGNAENDLPAHTEWDGEFPLVASVWEPNEEEREHIASGGNIELLVWAERTPPVALRTTPLVRVE